MAREADKTFISIDKLPRTETKISDNSKGETEGGFASMRNCKVKDASGDHYSDNVTGILRERLTFENFSTKTHDEMDLF
jgi:hypothetical protein